MGRAYSDKRREAYYKRAKKEGYRARSAYKLKQIQKKFRVVKRGDAAVDLGCSPGGWTQVLVELVGQDDGVVVGVDLARTPPVEGAVILQGDMTDAATQEQVRQALGRIRADGRADVVVSDMAPNISGNYSRDQAESAWLAGHAVDFAEQNLQKGGNLVFKVFEGQDLPDMMQRVKALFARVYVFSPPATRKRSSEVYVVCQGLRRTQAAGPP